MSEEICERFLDQFYDASRYKGGTNDFPVKEAAVAKISFQSLQLESTDEVGHKDFEYFPKRISVEDFAIPKFEMRLAANQGNLKQLAAILSVKRMTVKRCVRPKFEELSAMAIAPGNAKPPVSSVHRLHHQGSVEKKRCSFPGTLPEIVHAVREQQEKDTRL